MKLKEIKSILDACINLYDIVSTDIIFEIIKKYNLKINKKLLINKIIKVCSNDDDCKIWKIGQDEYLVAEDGFEKEQIDDLINFKIIDCYYVPDTYKEFLEYANSKTLSHTSEAYDVLSYLSFNKFDNYIEWSDLEIAYWDLSMGSTYEDFCKTLRKSKIKYSKNGTDVDLKFLFNKMYTNFRFSQLNGYTINELTKLGFSFEEIINSLKKYGEIFED